MRKAFFAAVSFCGLLFSGISLADPVTQISDPSLVDLITKVEVLASQDLSINRRLPLAVRVLKVSEDGECDGTPESCPLEKIYVAVSDFDLEPNRKVYQLPDAYGWEFSGWEFVPMDNEADDTFFIILTRKVVSPTIASGWWQNRAYRLRVNLKEAILEPIP